MALAVRVQICYSMQVSEGRAAGEREEIGAKTVSAAEGARAAAGVVVRVLRVSQQVPVAGVAHSSEMLPIYVVGAGTDAVVVSRRSVVGRCAADCCVYETAMEGADGTWRCLQANGSSAQGGIAGWCCDNRDKNVGTGV